MLVKRNNKTQPMSNCLSYASFFSDFNADNNQQSKKNNNNDVDWFGDFGKP